MKQMLPGIVRTLGDVGNIAIGEQKQILDSTMGSLLSGSDSVAKRLNQLADLAENTINYKLQNYSKASEYGIEGLIQTPTPTPAPTAAQTEQQMDADAAKWLKIYNNPPSEKHKELAEQLLRKKGLL